MPSNLSRMYPPWQENDDDRFRPPYVANATLMDEGPNDRTESRRRFIRNRHGSGHRRAHLSSRYLPSITVGAGKMVPAHLSVVTPSVPGIVLGRWRQIWVRNRAKSHRWVKVTRRSVHVQDTTMPRGTKAWTFARS